jgi:simple sugar transport system ATP-binding protein
MDSVAVPATTPASFSREALVLSDVSKSFGPTLALDEVSVSIGAGEARALLGRNGAGKSTLIAIITGLLHPDSGSVAFGSGTQRHAADAVACVYQRSTLVPGLTAAENILLGAYPTRMGLVDWAEVDRRARSLLSEWDCEWLADELVETLDPVHKKIVEICRALGGGADILLLDEPTAGLDSEATERLFEHIASLRRRGVTVVYVSHYLEEVFQVCDSVTVLRDGRNVMTASLGGLTVSDLVDAMVGEFDELAEPGTPPETWTTADDVEKRPTVLRVEGLSAGPLLERFDVEIAEGECVGLVGLEGSGIVEVAESLAGVRVPGAGSVWVDGKAVALGEVSRSIRHGIGFLPEDRQASGFVPGMGNEENATMTILDRIRNRLRLIHTGRRRAIYNDLARAWNIKAASAEQFTEELSGGNQQKVALARAFAGKPRVLVLVNPTHGVDVAAKASIFESIAASVVSEHRAALIVSTDDTEFETCSRLLVMFRGRVVAELTPPWSETILAAAVQGSLADLETGGGATPEGQVTP